MTQRPPIRATLAQLRSFEAVARLGGVGRAAVVLHLAQPTVSSQLRELASAVGLTLFVPRGRGLEITDEGELLLATVRELFAVWDRFEDDAARMRGLERGRLRIAAVTTAEYFLPDLIGPFAHAHPGLQIELAVENRDAIVRRLERGDDELAVMMLPPADLPLQRWPFLENPLVVVAPVGHPLASRKRLKLEQVVGEPLLAREAGSGTRRAADRLLEQRGVRWTPRMALGSNEAIKHAVAAGLGLAVLSRHTLGRDPARDGLTELPVQGFPIRRMWHLVWRRDRALSRPAQAFLDHLRRGR
ncbi:MAG: LysR family transcriptional regulator [Rhodoferax sp.]|jgi:DNA-binding transcriptional LysR family regulator|nr:LysR family transcriptional regulator [Rhodoferax sp.]MCL4738549.1 LysR family transcriptional regulator [Burkholderiaceae bacterium]MCP5289814.1 LysR family transcriptional regulator [Burkholderiaceae bacterium]HMQ73139.1 LysR family transcriptional regulator [Rubrivivax sp.]